MCAAAYLPIGDYALIGDCHGAALVSRDGAIDWACLARFDEAAIFCRLLDAEKGGTFAIVPRDPTGVSRRYLPDSNVLETSFETKTGVARVLDCFTMRHGGRTHPYRQLLRTVEGISGEVAFDILIQPRFDYASLRPWLRHHADRRVYSAVGGDSALVLQADIPLEISQPDSSLSGPMTVGSRQRRRFSILAQLPHDMRITRLSSTALDGRLKSTTTWWRRWVRRGKYDPTYREQVVRSALVLKLLTCAPTGAIIAAPTTSLPELPGGERNWDYRFCWIRDSAHMLAALFAVGHPEEATSFKLFIERTAAGHGDDVQVVYGCYGQRRIAEQELDHLQGYRGSRPVRAGNHAADQVQLDVYGELLNASHLWRRAGNEISEDGWPFLRGLVDAACKHWNEPDHGFWEVRGKLLHFVESKVMCWVALERGIRAAEELALPSDLDRWRAVQSEIRATIERDGVDPERGCFVQSFGSREVDASLLLLPIVGFVGPNDPRMKATVAAIERDLSDGLLVRRYRNEAIDDGLTGGEGAFLMAAFWLVDVLAMQGRLEEAESRFQRLLELANDVGLLAEEFDPTTGELLGNFPQGLTHMALINSAEQIQRARSGASYTPVVERGNVHPNRPVARKTLHHAPAFWTKRRSVRKASE